MPLFPRRTLRQNISTTAAPPREDPAVIGRLYHACEEELCMIVFCLHGAVALEGVQQTASTVCSAIASDGIRHYKLLCRLLRELGVPFRLQTRITCPQITLTGDPFVASTDLLNTLRQRTADAKSTYRHISDRAREHATRQALLTLTEEKEGHYSTLQAMTTRLTRS